MDNKCRAKDPSRCRVHGTHADERRLHDAIEKKNLNDYFAVRESLELESLNPSESEAYKKTLTSVTNWVYGDEATVENMPPEEREEAQITAERITDLAVQHVKPNLYGRGRLTQYQVAMFAEEIYYARGHGKQYMYEYAKPELIRDLKVESRRMLEGITTFLYSIPAQARPRN